MAVDQSEILKEAVEKLRADPALQALLGGQRVFNHVPQDDDKPYLVVVWEGSNDWDTKDSLGFDGSLSHEVVSPHHSDRDVLRVVERVRKLYEESPLEITSGQIVSFEYSSGSVPVAVLETHRALALFSVLVDSEDIGVLAVLIIKDEGVNLPNTPHEALNFEGAGVTATDEGSGVAKVTVPGGGGGGGLVFDWEQLKTSGFPGSMTQIPFFGFFRDSGNLLYQLNVNLEVKAASITSEVGFTVVDPDDIIDGDPWFFTLGEGRVVRFNTKATAIGGQTATISWTWNGIPYECLVTVVSEG